MKKGIESLREAVLTDTRQYNNCFNENGCDHEFTRIVPETNPGLLEMGIKTCCKMVSKCSHKYCDTYKWVIDRAKHYAEKTGRTYEEIIEIWESNRTCWYMGYYQDAHQPLNGSKASGEELIKLRSKISDLQKDLKVWKFLAGTLTMSHQESVKNELLSKVKNMEAEIHGYKSRVKLLEISCFETIPVQ